MSRNALCLAFLAAAILAAAPAARADWAVLRNGQRIHVTGHERRGSEVILQLAGGEAALPAAAVLRFEPEDIFPAAQSAPASGPYGAIVAKAASQNGLDRNLLSSVIRAESDFHPRAVSPKGALGLMQLMPSTARSLAVRNPFDPAENVEGGARYLKGLLGKFGDLNLALAAYNAGPGNVSLYGGIPPFTETHAYIARVRRDMKKKTGKKPGSGLVKMICSPLEPRCHEESASPTEASRLRRP
ncbi:MAG: lytic transglycosylase domain-containing protein [Acidobacteriota bacterium]|nr:lytic transglycosylase domain-containing protein [Acidobacteriota bacterium]